MTGAPEARSGRPAPPAGHRLGGFWRRPDRRVWILFLGSMVVFTASMLTLREGLRFVSRPLEPAERRIAEGAVDLWDRLSPPEERGAPAAVRDLLRRGLLRAMDRRSFARREERITLGYTDERGRILLNPSICFGSFHTLGPAIAGDLHPGDLVRTMSTLYHERLHLHERASEPEAYEAEWLFLRRCARRLEALDPESPLLPELRDWERDMPGRVEAYVGAARMAGIRRRVLEASGG